MTITDCADLELNECSVADMIDETGPHMIRNITKHLSHCRLIEFFRAAKYLWIYYSKTLQLVGRRYRHITVVSHDDAQRLRKLLPSKSTTVIPNGVDLPAHFSRNPSFDNPVVLFHGVYGYEPNEEAALFLIKKVAPLLVMKWPHCRILIVGRNPTSRMLEAASFATNVEIVGEVDNISDYLLAASVGVYPIFTRTGLQNKILEAWAHGLPVVTTPGIMSVFDAFSRDARHCARTALSEHEFAAQIGALLGEPDTCSQLSTRSFEFVKKHFDWQGVVERFLQLGIDNGSIG
jgi:glycosyltransferase involved in cell wall biosynthesis